MFRGALREAVTGLFSQVDIAEAGTFEEVTDLAERGGDVDLVLLDLKMPGVRGFSGPDVPARPISGVPVAVVSASDEPTTSAAAWISAPPASSPNRSPSKVSAGDRRHPRAASIWAPPESTSAPGRRREHELVARLATLTPQQVRVLMMLGEGLLNKQIAYELGVSEATVKAHVSAILQKLGVDSRTQAVIAAGKIEAGQWPQHCLDAEREQSRYSAAARCAATARSARASAAGLTGLFSAGCPAARASSRTRGERSAVMRIAGRSAVAAAQRAMAPTPLPPSRW